MSNTLLLLSNRKEDEVFAGEVCKVAGLNLKCVQNADDAARVMDSDEPSAVIIDGSTPELHAAFETAIQSTIGLFSDKVRSNTIHFLSDSEINQAAYLIHSPILGSFLTRDLENLASSGAHYGRIVNATIKERAFGLDSLFQGKIKIQTLNLTQAAQKSEVLDVIKNYLVAAKFNTRTISGIITAIDELLMNAIYDAPTDELGNHIYTTTLRSENLKLEGKHAVSVSLGFDGNYVGISISDQFGSLDKGKLMTHISREYGESEYKLKSNVAGAGIGLATIHRSGGSLFFISEAGVKTEVVTFYKKVESYKDFRKQFRFVSTQFYF